MHTEQLAATHLLLPAPTATSMLLRKTIDGLQPFPTLRMLYKDIKDAIPGF